MRLLTFDLGKYTGWAAWDGKSSLPSHKMKTLVGWDYEPAAFLAFQRKWLGEMLKVHRPEVVAIERWYLPQHGDGKTIAQQIALSFFFQWALRSAGIPFHILQPNQWRKETFGKAVLNTGEDWKTKALNRVAARGIEGVTDHNEAEAILLMDWLATHYRFNLPWRTERLVA
ncbi:MAG: hypothetical protein U9R73_00715 [Pseudomonadota bacterium]|nr:hypothetical protein [Pseudomonadota bacterium]